MDWRALQSTEREFGVALRVGTQKITPGSRQETFILNTARELADSARRFGAFEFHVDYDCPESRLREYAGWLRRVRAVTPDMRLTITSLPSWLDRSAFKDVLRVVDEHVLQVHSLDRPKSARDPLQLCDPEAARKAIARAERLAKPFWVALPTYSYLAAFDPLGKFLAVRAETGSFSATNAIIREVRSSPEQLADLVRWLSERHNHFLSGVIWYRLPIASDELNWRWETLASVKNGIAPAPHLDVTLVSTNTLHQIVLRNTGNERATSKVAIEITWKSNDPIAADALNHFSIAERRNNRIVFTSTASIPPLDPNKERKIGWIRLKNEGTQIEPRLFIPP